VTVEMGSGAMMYVPSLMQIGSAIHTLIGRIHRHAVTQNGCFENKEIRLETGFMSSL
jgi:hypothetical protein